MSHRTYHRSGTCGLPATGNMAQAQGAKALLVCALLISYGAEGKGITRNVVGFTQVNDSDLDASTTQVSHQTAPLSGVNGTNYTSYTQAVEHGDSRQDPLVRRPTDSQGAAAGAAAAAAAAAAVAANGGSVGKLGSSNGLVSTTPYVVSAGKLPSKIKLPRKPHPSGSYCRGLRLSSEMTPTRTAQASNVAGPAPEETDNKPDADLPMPVSQDKRHHQHRKHSVLPSGHRCGLYVRVWVGSSHGGRLLTSYKIDPTGSAQASNGAGLGQQLTGLLRKAGQLLTGLLQKAGHLAVPALRLLSPAAVADEAPVNVRLPASEKPEVYAAQQTLFQAWTLVGKHFIDKDFNGHWWPHELKRHMMAAYNSGTGKEAYEQISQMLSKLGDPYTHIIPASEYADFRERIEGEFQGAGLMVVNDPVTNHLLVLNVNRGGPADRAGMVSGDVVISFNDHPTEGWTGDMAAGLLLGMMEGTEVRVKFVRRTSCIPGVAFWPESCMEGLPYCKDEGATVKEVRLRLEKIAVSPVYYTALQIDAAASSSDLSGFTISSAPPPTDPDSSSNSSRDLLVTMGATYGLEREGYSSTAPGRKPLNATTSSSANGPLSMSGVPAVGLVGAAQEPPSRWGYLRLTSFSPNAANETKQAIISLERKGVSGYILDLRDNPGGFVRAAIDIARLLMDGHPTLFSIVGRPGKEAQQVVLGEGELSNAPAEAITHKPLVVLVNQHSASASETLAGALRDNGRALLVGDTNTNGKGSAQSVYELHDGSALFVTVAKYVTPSGTVIDQKGLKPDTSCSLGSLMGPDGPEEGPDRLGRMVMEALFWSGAEEALVSALSSDPCVLKAATVLREKAAVVRSTA